MLSVYVLYLYINNISFKEHHWRLPQ